MRIEGLEQIKRKSTLLDYVTLSQSSWDKSPLGSNIPMHDEDRRSIAKMPKKKSEKTKRIYQNLVSIQGPTGHRAFAIWACWRKTTRLF